MPRPSYVTAAAAVLSALFLAQCVRVPAPDELGKGPQVDEIVRRVKCDIYEAVQGPLTAPSGYAWLHPWTVQASLNLIVNDQTQINPGATFTQPLTTESIPARVTNMARSFSFGLGAQANNTATRNETVTFTVSMDELMDQFGKSRQNCDFPNYVDLRSELGLKQWVAAALSPVVDGDLNVGYHKTPKSGSAAAAASVQKALGAAPASAPKQSPPANAPGVPSCLDPTNIPQRPTGPPSLETLHLDDAIVLCELSLLRPSQGKGYIDLTKQLDGEQVKSIAQIIKDIDRLNTELAMANTAAAARESARLKKVAISLSVFVDPPLDTISHQVQFIIVWNASASPSWTLLHFKGPSPSSGSLFSATQTKTHTLNIAIGPPSSPDTQSALQALQIGTAVGNAIGTSGLPPP